MADVFSWQSPSSKLVLNGILDTLAELGYRGLTVDEVTTRAGAAGPALGDSPDLEALVIVALEQIELFPAPVPKGNLRQDLRTLLDLWHRALSRDERAVAAVLSAATLRPRLRVAVHGALDRPLTNSVAVMVAQSSAPRHVPTAAVQTLCWVLRGLIVDRLRSGPRSSVDIDLLVDFLVAGLHVEPADNRATEAAARRADETQSAPA